MSVLIIAEAGVNHNGSVEIAKKLIDVAKEIGVDIIKFQTFKSDKMTSKIAQKATYQVKTTNNNESQLAMLKKLELSYEDFKELKDYCNKIDIEFLSTAFDLESVEFLNSSGMNLWKIPSGEITNLPYLQKIAAYNKPVILSTGMSTMSEIEEAVNVFKTYECPLTVLHCTTEYPAPLNQVNLNVMETLKSRFSCEIGYSDHTEGIEISLAAVALGAKVIEKHITLDKNMEGPDHKASLNPIEFKALVEGIRHIELALGSNIKEPTTSEESNKLVARKSIVASQKIEKGEIFTIDNLTTKRPGTGISPMRWYEFIGQISNRDYEEDELIVE